MRGAVLPVLSLLLFATVAFVPGAAAGPSTCSDEAVATAAGMHVRMGGIRSELWQEQNGIGGLQTTSCTFGGNIYGADGFVRQAVPQDLGFGGPCVFGLVISQCI